MKPPTTFVINTTIVFFIMILLVGLCTQWSKTQRSTKAEEAIVATESPSSRMPEARPSQRNRHKTEPPRQGTKPNDIPIVSFDLSAESLRSSVTIVERLPAQLLKEIRSSMKRLERGEDTMRPIQDWYEARSRLTSESLMLFSPKTIPDRIFEDAGYFFFAESNNPDFTRGYAIRKVDGGIYSWTELFEMGVTKD